MEITELDKKIVRAMQDELPLVAEPFKLIAEEIDSTEEEVLGRLQLMRASGALRKMGAVLKHREVGFKSNALCVWVVPEERMDEIAEIMCRHMAVTHCYDRNIMPGWPYNFYTMIHGTSREDCDSIAKQLSEETGIGEYTMLYTGREWKKTSMKYFM